jgi:hypothetical protein
MLLLYMQEATTHLMPAASTHNNSPVTHPHRGLNRLKKKLDVKVDELAIDVL